MMPNSIIRDAIAININKIVNPRADVWDFTNRRRKTGAIQAASETIHLPLEKINNMIPAIIRIYVDSKLYFSLAVFICLYLSASGGISYFGHMELVPIYWDLFHITNTPH